MNELITFTNNALGNVRSILIDGEPWFIAADVCQILGLGDTSKAVSRLDVDEKGTNSIRTLGGEQEVLIINEPGLYSLLLTSRKDEAKLFKRWVTHEVLPAIRKQGFYSSLSDEQLLELLTNRQKENPKFLYDASLKQQERKELLKLTQNERLVQLWEKRANLDCSQYLWALNEITGGNLSLFNKHFRKYESYLEQKRKYEILTDKVHP